MYAKSALAVIALAAASSLTLSAGDSARGLQLFTSEHCIDCHSIQGKGGNGLAPDLGTRTGRDYTPYYLASRMWNHAPKMWEEMEQRNLRRPILGERDAADLFAYFYSVRYFDRPGDAGRGKHVFETKHCADCHGLTEPKAGTAAKPVVEWRSFGDPILLVEDMWRHAAIMKNSFEQRKIPWPTMTSQDLTDLSVYLRNLPKTHLPEPNLTLVDSATGKELFHEKGCDGCHKGKMSLEKLAGFRTLTSVAAAMWDHAPKMAVAKPIEPGEMRQIVSYVWDRQFFEAKGNPAHGKEVFAKKGCAGCHEDISSGAPKLPQTGQQYSAVSMIAVLWKHGPQMLRQMNAKKIAWPTLSETDMADLVAYLSTGS